jgi:hypothetical protein
MNPPKKKNSPKLFFKKRQAFISKKGCVSFTTESKIIKINSPKIGYKHPISKE